MLEPCRVQGYQPGHTDPNSPASRTNMGIFLGYIPIFGHLFDAALPLYGHELISRGCYGMGVCCGVRRNYSHTLSQNKGWGCGVRYRVGTTTPSTGPRQFWVIYFVLGSFIFGFVGISFQLLGRLRKNADNRDISDTDTFVSSSSLIS